jgi:hypothetical protein
VSSFKQKVAVSPFTNAEGDWQRIQNWPCQSSCVEHSTAIRKLYRCAL